MRSLVPHWAPHSSLPPSIHLRRLMQTALQTGQIGTMLQFRKPCNLRAHLWVAVPLMRSFGMVTRMTATRGSQPGQVVMLQAIMVSSLVLLSRLAAVIGMTGGTLHSQLLCSRQQRTSNMAAPRMLQILSAMGCMHFQMKQAQAGRTKTMTGVTRQGKAPSKQMQRLLLRRQLQVSVPVLHGVMTGTKTQGLDGCDADLSDRMVYARGALASIACNHAIQLRAHCRRESCKSAWAAVVSIVAGACTAPPCSSSEHQVFTCMVQIPIRSICGRFCGAHDHAALFADQICARASHAVPSCSRVGLSRLGHRTMKS